MAPRYASRTSRLSLKAVQSAAVAVPRSKACPWVAHWFSVQQCCLKCLELVLAVAAVALMFSWQSKGVTISDLDSGSFNVRNRLYSYMGLGLLSIGHSIGLIGLGIGGVRLPPSLQTFLSGTLLALWLLGAPVMSATVQELNNSRFARTAGVGTVHLKVAALMGFFSLVAFVVDILLAFQALTSLDDSDSSQFAVEVRKSKSVLHAVKSGRSLAEARRAQTSATVPRRASRLSWRERRERGQSEGGEITETSPLKSSELDSSTEV